MESFNVFANKKLSVEDFVKSIADKNDVSRKNYYAMYSSWWDGIITDPNFMLIPVDDHQVHRGDAVFEAMKSVKGKIYLETEHLNRLARSAHAISLNNPYTQNEISNILKQTLKAAVEVSGSTDAILRLFLSRGPGSFSPSPYDTIGTQLYLVVTKFQPYSLEKLENGVSLGLSKISPKEPWLAQIKSCNYLQNVLMKKEAIDLGYDFTVGVNAEGFITEGSTENLVVVTGDGDLLRPKSENILMGTTMMRAFELAKKIGEIRSIQEKNFKYEDLLNAREVMMIGTTIDVLAVTKIEDHRVSNGQPGSISKQLRELLIKDQIFLQ